MSQKQVVSIILKIKKIRYVFKINKRILPYYIPGKAFSAFSSQPALANLCWKQNSLFPLSQIASSSLKTPDG